MKTLLKSTLIAAVLATAGFAAFSHTPGESGPGYMMGGGGPGHMMGGGPMGAGGPGFKGNFDPAKMQARMDRTGERGTFERGAVRMIGRQRHADFRRQAADPAHGGLRHFLFHNDLHPAQIDRMPLRENPHDGGHACAEGRRAEIGRGK